MSWRRWHNRLFRAFLRLFPSEFRERFGAEMADDFQDQYDDARRTRGLKRLWFRTSRDLAGRAMLEHLDTLRRDLAFTARSSRRHPALALTIVATLAVAIGLNTAVFSVADGVLLRSLPYDGEQRLVQLYDLSPEPERERQSVSPGNFVDWAAEASTIDVMVAVSSMDLTVAGAGDPERVEAMVVSEGFFRMFPSRPVVGRLFTPADHDVAKAGPPAAVILSHDLWQRRFNGRPDVVGQTVRTAFGSAAEVVGVLPPDFHFREVPGRARADAWLATSPNPNQRRARYLTAIGRLAPGAAVAAAQAEMDLVAAKLALAHPDVNAGREIGIVPLHEVVVESVRSQMWFLFGAALCALLVAGANVAGLLLAFERGQRYELATRIALGASRARLVRQAVTHSLSLSALGGAAGMLLAFGLVRMIVALAPVEIPRLDEIVVDVRVLAFSLVLTTLVGVLCGIAPVLMTAHRATANVLRLTGADARARGRRVRYGLAIAEVAVALMLVVAAGLMVRTVRAVGALELGFVADHLISIGLTPDISQWRARGGMSAFESTLLERIRALPQVVAAGIGSRPLGGAGLGMGVELPGVDNEERQCCAADSVSPGYLEALGAQLVEGRFFRQQDADDGAGVMLVNQAAARLGWPDRTAVGRVVDVDGQSLRVVGVVHDVRRDGLEPAPEPTIYLVSSRTPSLWTNNLIVRTHGDPAEILPAVRAIMRDIDPTQALTRIQTMEQALAGARAPRQFTLQLIGMFSLIALGLAALGVYGLVSESVSQRLPEFGIRMALGATPARILGAVVAHGAGIVVIGAAAGLACAVAVNRTMTSLVFGVETTDAGTYGVAAVVLFAATLTACLLPAWRAATVDPVRALRQQ